MSILARVFDWFCLNLNMLRNGRLIGIIGVALMLQGCSKKVVTPTFDMEPSKRLSIQEIDFEYFQGKARLNFRDSNLDDIFSYWRAGWQGLDQQRFDYGCEHR